LNVPTSQTNNVTTGRIYLSLLKREEVFKENSVVSHIMTMNTENAWQFWRYDIVITEIGGTVGTSDPTLYESVRQMVRDLRPSAVILATLFSMLEN
jgi:CTP synthase